mmetsp:Transcript_84354/g.188360  ORF Transcript_84354/g.188360 Transcript_84354/m.188360 type:complete len:493 (-) Transcript_84354:63-1541(-)
MEEVRDGPHLVTEGREDGAHGLHQHRDLGAARDGRVDRGDGLVVQVPLVRLQLRADEDQADVGARSLGGDGEALLGAALVDAVGRREAQHVDVLVRVGALEVVPSLVRRRAEHGNGLARVLRSGDGQNAPVVLEKGHGRARSPHCGEGVLVTARARGKLRGTRQLALGVLLQPQVPNAGDDPHGRLLQGRQQLLVLRELLRGTDRQVGAHHDMLHLRRVVRAVLGRHDETMELHGALQVRVQGQHVLAGPRAVHLLICAHDPRGTVVHGSLERRVELVPLGRLVDRPLHGAEELRHGQDPLLVSSQHPVPRHHAPQGGVLAGQGVEALVVHPRPVDIDGGPEHRVRAQGLELLGDGRRHLADAVRVEGGCERQVGREVCHLRDLLDVLRLEAWDGARDLEGRDGPQGTGLALVGAALRVDVVGELLRAQSVRDVLTVGGGVEPLRRPAGFSADVGAVGVVDPVVRVHLQAQGLRERAIGDRDRGHANRKGER